jgi:hypothetical protein
LRAPHQPRPVSKKRANKPARTADKRHVQKIKQSRSNLNIHVCEISADAIRRDRVIDDFLVVDRDLGWSEQRQIGQVPHGLAEFQLESDRSDSMRAASYLRPSSADFIIIIAESNFRYRQPVHRSDDRVRLTLWLCHRSAGPQTPCLDQRYNESYCRMDCTPDHRGIPLE